MKIVTKKIIYFEVWQHKILMEVLQDKFPRILEIIDKQTAKGLCDKLEDVCIKDIQARNFIKDLKKELKKF